MAGTQGIRAGRAYVELSTQNNILQGLKRGLSQIKSYVTEAASVAKIPLGISVAGLGAAAVVTKQFASFDDQMRLAAAVSGATSKELSRLTDVAKELGRTTSWTAEQVAAGMVSLGRMGFDSTEIENATDSVMNLARATGTEIGLATDIAGSALRSFEMDASQMGKVADILTTTANSSAQTLEDLGESLKYVSPIARAAGLDLKETSTVLGLLANFGIRGSQAGTSVKTLMTRLADEKISGKIKASTGVEVTDDAGNLRAVSDVLSDIGNAVRDMPNGEQLSLFKNLFGLESMASGVNLATADFTAMREAMAGVDGAAQRTAEAMDAGVGGSLRIAQSAVEGVALALGEKLSPLVIELTDNLSRNLTPITQWISTNEAMIRSTAKILGVIGGVSAAIVGLGVAASSTVQIVGFVVKSWNLAYSAFNAVTRQTELLTAATKAHQAVESAELAMGQARARLSAANMGIQVAERNIKNELTVSLTASTAAERAAASARLQTAIAAKAAAIATQTEALTAKTGAQAQVFHAKALETATLATYRLKAALIAVAGTVAAVAAVGAAFYWVGGWAEKATEGTQKQIDKVKEEYQARQQQFQSADQLMNRLKELDSIQNKSNEQQAEAVGIIQQLTAQYGDLGLSIDAATGKINGFITAEEGLSRRKLVAELESRKALKSKNETRLNALKSEQSKLGGNANFIEGASMGIRYGVGSWFGGKSFSDRMAEIGAERKTLSAENNVLDAEIQSLQARIDGMNKDKQEREKQAQNPPELPQKTKEELDIEAEQKALASAKQSVLFARVDLANAEKDGDQQTIDEAREALADAEKELARAKQNVLFARVDLANAEKNGDQQTIDEAREALADAEKELASVEQDVLFAKADLANAEKGIDQERIDEAREALADAEKELAEVEKTNATAAADRAATQYEQAKQSGDEAQIKEATENLETALNAVDRFETTVEEEKEETPLSETERTLNALLGQNTLDAAQKGVEDSQQRQYLNDLKDAFAIQEAQKKVEAAQAGLAFENVFGDSESQIAANKEFTAASEQLNQLLEARGLAGGALETTQAQQGTFDAWEALSLGADDWEKEETKKTNRFLDLLQKDVASIVKNMNEQDEDVI